MESKMDCPRAGGALVLWLWAETHVLKIVGSNPSTIYWMDIFHIILLKKLLCLREKMKTNEKETGD